MMVLVLALAVSADPAPQFAVSNRCPQKFVVVNKACAPCGTACPCAGSCPTACPVPHLAPVRGADRHVSPDGTVNELCADGIYRPVPGLTKASPPAPVSAPQYLYAPTYSYPSFGGCAGGRCPTR